MKTLSVLLGAMVLAATASAQVSADRASQTAQILLDHLDAGRFSQAEAMFSDSMKALVPEDKLKAAWGSMAPSVKRGAFKLGTKDDLRFVLVPMLRGKAAWQASIAVDTAGKVTGLYIQPQTETSPVPALASDATFIERELTVGSGADALPATFSMPNGKGPFPAVVLVHGSGAHDRNETIGANRPFLDLARGLAAQGIAVLRYEKRSKAMPGWYANHPVTIDNETTDDAVLALAALRAQPGIDAKRVFVLGHSQGAMLAPRIATRDGRVAGVIELSGPARKLVDVLPEQMRFMGTSAKVPPEKTEENIRLLEVAIRKFRDPAYEGASLMGQPASYWRSVDTVDPIADVRNSSAPVLILHGGRDFQVTDTDWQLWQRHLKNAPRVTLKRYPALNHLGIAGKGPPDMAEYSTPGHVDAGLLRDVATWIKAH